MIDLLKIDAPVPFALNLSKGQAELVEACFLFAKGFDKLSPTGDEALLRYLRANGDHP